MIVQQDNTMNTPVRYLVWIVLPENIILIQAKLAALAVPWVLSQHRLGMLFVLHVRQVNITIR